MEFLDEYTKEIFSMNEEKDIKEICSEDIEDTEDDEYYIPNKIKFCNVCHTIVAPYGLIYCAVCNQIICIGCSYRCHKCYFPTDFLCKNCFKRFNLINLICSTCKQIDDRIASDIKNTTIHYTELKKILELPEDIEDIPE